MSPTSASISHPANSRGQIPLLVRHFQRPRCLIFQYEKPNPNRALNLHPTQNISLPSHSHQRRHGLCPGDPLHDILATHGPPDRFQNSPAPVHFRVCSWLVSAWKASSELVTWLALSQPSALSLCPCPSFKHAVILLFTVLISLLTFFFLLAELSLAFCHSRVNFKRTKTLSCVELCIHDLNPDGHTRGTQKYLCHDSFLFEIQHCTQWSDNRLKV